MNNIEAQKAADNAAFSVRKQILWNIPLSQSIEITIKIRNRWRQSNGTKKHIQGYCNPHVR